MEFLARDREAHARMVEGLLKTAVVVLLKIKTVAVAGDVGVSTDAANYV